LRSEFREKIQKIDKKLLIFLDESGIEDNACIEYGWSIKGFRCYDVRPHKHKRRINMIAGLSSDKIIAPLVFEGTCDSTLFETYVEGILMKELTPGQFVIMDNVNFHKTDKVKSLIQSAGCEIIFLPPYSPDLNLIEHHWFKIKNRIRKIAQNFEDFFDAVCLTLKNINESLA
jgi:transposase